MGFRNKKAKLAFLAFALAFVSVFGLRLWESNVSAATPGDVVINEIMYHASSDDENDEFLELYNTTGSQIDLDGWCFTDGIDLCFTSGQTIDANGYIIVSPNNAQTNTTYGISPPYGEYTGKLSNGGETVTLEDNTNTVVSTVTYSDSSPWPITPDELGPSLELNDPSGDISDPFNWGASTDDFSTTPDEHFTPNAENNIFTSGRPVIKNVTDPNDVDANTAVPITAEVSGGTISSVELNYKINFDADITLTMHDDGSHNDGSAGDGVYGAAIPAQTLKKLVRFNIKATNNSGSTSSPRYDDSQRYHGYFIADPSITSNAELLEWFISDADYADMKANHRYDDEYLPCVIVYGNDVYSTSEVRIKGEISRQYTKTSYKIKLPRNYTINPEGGSNRRIDEFHLAGVFHSGTIASDLTAWWMIEQAGMPVPDMTAVRIQKNGEFEGMYVLQEKYEKEWRDDYNRDNGGFYEDYSEVVSGADDLTAIDAMYDKVAVDRNNPQRSNAVLDDIDVPNILNFSSTMTLLSSWDHYAKTNNFYYQDGDTGRWSMYFWDMSPAFSSGEQGFDYPSVYDHFQYATPDIKSFRFLQTAVYDQTDLRSAYMRRIRTLYDKMFANDAVSNHMSNLDEQFYNDMYLDLNKWPLDSSNNYAIRKRLSEFLRQIEGIKIHLIGMHSQPWGIPGSQTDAERESVSLAEVVPNASNDQEYIRLYNAANTAVDISDWKIEGLNYTIPAGAVIPANSSIYLLRDDSGYKAAHDPVLVAGQYETDLNDIVGTDLVLVTNTNAEIDIYDH